MLIQKIEQLAKCKHAKLLATVGLMTCLVLGGSVSASASAFPSINTVEFSKPSTKVARETNLHTQFAHHTIKSPQFDRLLLHQFNVTQDSDLTEGHSFLGMIGNKKPINNAKFKFVNGVIRASDGSNYSDVSDIYARHGEEQQMTYYFTKHTMFLRELGMGNATHNALRTVRYRLHSVSHNPNKVIEDMIFYPVSYSTKHSNTFKISNKNQSLYPLHMYVKQQVASFDSSAGNVFNH